MVKSIQVGDWVKLNKDAFYSRRYQEHPYIDSLWFQVTQVSGVTNSSSSGLFSIKLNQKFGGYKQRNNGVLENNTTFNVHKSHIVDVRSNINEEPLSSTKNIKPGDLVTLNASLSLNNESIYAELNGTGNNAYEVIAASGRVVFLHFPKSGVITPFTDNKKVLSVDRFEIKTIIPAEVKTDDSKPEDKMDSIKAGDTVTFSEYGKSQLKDGFIFAVLSNFDRNNFDLTQQFKVELVQDYETIRIRLPNNLAEKLGQGTWSLSAKNLAKVVPIKEKSDKINAGDFVILSQEGREQFKKGYLLSFLKDPERREFDIANQRFKINRVTDNNNAADIDIPSHIGSVKFWRVDLSHIEKVKPSCTDKNDLEKSEMKKKQKFDVKNTVFVPARFANKLPDNFVNGRPTADYYEFEIIHRESNSQSSDYFLKISDLDGGKFEMRIHKTGWWMNEDFLLSEEEKNEDEKVLNKKEKAMTTLTGTEETNTDMVEYEKQMKEVRVFDAILSPAIEFSKTCIRYVVHVALGAIGKTNKFINGAIMMLEDFFEQNKEIANNAIRWILGFLSKNLHHIRKIPVVGEWKALAFLERKDIQRFGIYAQASSEGGVIGDLSTKILGWLQDWIFGSAVATRISEAITSPEGMMRFVSEMNSEMKGQLAEKLRVEAEATNEAMEAMEDKMQTATA